MKKILLLIVMPFVFFPALSAQITQEEADEIVLEHIINRYSTSSSYTLFAKEELQAEGITIAPSTGEVLELDYACWAYYVRYANTGRFLIVKANNGNLLEVNAKVDEGDLAKWKIRVVGSQSNCDQDIIISPDEFENAPNFYLSIIDMKIVDDCLKIKFGSSGCSGNTWVVKLIDSGIIAESIPCQRTLRLSLDNQEACAAAFTKEVSFNIKDLQIKGDNKVLLNISGKSILYEYDIEKDIQHVKTELGGCNINAGLRSESDDPRKDEVIISTTKDSVHVSVGINYYCSTPFDTQCTIQNDTIKMYVTDICGDFSVCYAKCYCYYTFDFQFERKSETNYNYVVELISPLEGKSKILSEGKIEAENTPFSTAQMTTSVNNFSMNFFATAYEELNSDENIVLSPLSLNMALAMVWNGANGDTRQGIQQAMGMQNYSQTEVNNYFLNLRNTLTTADPDVKLALANSIWYDNGFPVKNDFIAVNKDYYDAEVNEIDFRASDAPDQINQWCSDNTNGLIKDMIKVIPGDVVMYLINALYFKGLWADSCGFDSKYTHQAYFNKETGENISVDMMRQKRKDIDYYSDGYLEMVSLPYGNGAYSMIFALPKGGFSEMLLQLKENAYWQNCLSNLKPQEAELFIPKFKVEYEPKPDLNGILKKLGMEKAFSPAFADFSGISDIRLFISQVKQKTFIEVDEKGTEAAAVTAIEMMFTSVPAHPVFRANRPFLFVIQENTTGTALFMGKIGYPK